MRDDEALAWGGLLRAFGHPTRLMILAELLKGTRCVNDMTELLARPQPNVSQHLMALRESGLVDFYREGLSRCYYLASPDFIRGLFDLLEQETRRPSETGQTAKRKREASQKVESSGGPGL